MGSRIMKHPPLDPIHWYCTQQQLNGPKLIRGFLWNIYRSIKRAARAMEANGRLERSNNKCLWPECLVEAAARDFKGFQGFKVLRLANGRLERPNNRGLRRQTAGCNALTTNACGQSAWRKLPRGIVRVLGVLTLANGRLERTNNRGQRLQSSNNKCLWPERLVEAVARDFKGF